LTSPERIKGLIQVTCQMVRESVIKAGWVRYLNFRTLPVISKDKEYSDDRLNRAVTGLLVAEIGQVERQRDNCAEQGKYTPTVQSADRSSLGYPVTLFSSQPATKSKPIPNEQYSGCQKDWRGRDQEY
jgi:hypothetical protein